MIEQMVANNRAGFITTPQNRTIAGIDSIRTGEFYLWIARQPDETINELEETDIPVSDQGLPNANSIGIQPICSMVSYVREYEGTKTIFRDRKTSQLEARRQNVAADHLVTFLHTTEIKLGINKSCRS
jgi:hypothetical protein